MDRITIVDLRGADIPLRVMKIRRQFYPTGFHRRALVYKDYALYYITEGALTFTGDAGSWTAKSGDIVFCSPGERSAWRADARLSYLHCHFQFENITPVVIDSALKQWAHVIAQAGASAMRNQDSVYLPDRITIKERDRIAELFAEMLREQTTPGPAQVLAFKGYFLLLLRLVSREVFQQLSEHGSPGRIRKTQRHVIRALQIIESSLAQPLSLHDVAGNLRLNAAYLSRLFKEYLGESIGSYVLQRKLTVAKDLLISTGLSVKEAAAAVGFRDALYFSRVFRREVGLSPTEYVEALVG